MDMQWQHEPVTHPTRGAEHSYTVLAHGLNDKRVAHIDRWPNGTHTIYLNGDTFGFESERLAYAFIDGLIAGQIRALEALGRAT